MTVTHAATVANGGSVEAGGDAVVSKAAVSAAVKSDQKAKQANSAIRPETEEAEPTPTRPRRA